MLKSGEEERSVVSLDERLKILKEIEHKGPVRSLNPRQKISDEDLLAVFTQIKGRWYRVEDLREALENLITVNTDNPKRTPVNSAYLRRLRRLTGYKWRQKRAVDSEGRYLVKVYIQKG